VPWERAGVGVVQFGSKLLLRRVEFSRRLDQMASLDDPAVFEELVPGVAALFLGLGLTVVTQTLWQLTSYRNYVWFIAPATAVAYTLVYAFYLRKACAGLRLKNLLIVQGLAFLMVWGGSTQLFASSTAASTDRPRPRWPRASWASTDASQHLC
jgi:hypothetical protein